MKRIMFMISSLNGGGAERVTVNLANELGKTHEVGVLILFSGTDAYTLAPYVKQHRFMDEVKDRKLKSKRFLKFYRWFWVRKRKREFCPDTTVSMLRAQNFYNILCGGKDRKILSERNDPSKDAKWSFWLKSFCYARADQVVFQSRRVRNMFRRKIRDKGIVILNPVDISITAAEPVEPRIVTVGRLNQQKNHALLIHAFEQFHKEHPNYTLEIYGKGPLEKDIAQLIQQKGLSQNVMLPGFDPQVHKKLEHAAMFVLSSDYEGLSNALLEALMMGLPCISTDCAGSDEILQDGDNGRLVPVGDVDRLAAAMKELAEAPELRERLAAGAKATAESFRTERVLEEWMKIL